jgi:hypothetical protein
MRTIVSIAGLAAILLSSLQGGFAKTPPASKDSPGTIVIVFKDGHRQTFNLSEIARVEFEGSHETAAPPPTGDQVPVRGQFIGRWVVGEGNGDNTFVITLKDSGDAMRSLHELHGTWKYVNGEARITWDDGAQDAIRKIGSRFQKYAYGAGKSFTDTPDNVTAARNTTPKPI